MKYVVEDKYEFVPEAGGNKDDESPTTFVCRYLTPSERDKAMPLEAVNRNGNAELRVIKNNDQLARYSVIEVLNCEVNGKQITDIKEYLKIRHPVIDAQLKELVDEILRRNVYEDLGN